MVVLCVVCLGSAAPAPADPGGPNPNNYTLSAAANSFDVVLDDPSAPLITEYELSPYGASAALNSLGQSSSDAGAPYSPTIAGLPPLLSGLGSGGQLPPIPSLPGYVAASFPGTSTNAEQQGPYAINAEASQYDSHGHVALGAGLAGSSGSTFSASAQTTANADGSVTVSASTGIDLLNIGGLLDIGNITSSARMTLAAGKKPNVTQSISLGTVSLLGSTTGLVGSQLKILGHALALPLVPTLIATLNHLLKPAGVGLTLLPAKYTYTDGTSTTATVAASKTIQSVDTGALQMTMAQNVATQGEVKLVVTIGRVSVSAINTPGFAPGPPPTDSGADSGSPGDGGIVVGGRGPGATVVPVVPAASSASGGVPSALPAVPTPSTAASAPPVQEAATLVFAKGPRADSAYLVLVIAALAALAGSVLIRVLGVRAALGSSFIRHRPGSAA
jgi:hypothetical protein